MSLEKNFGQELLDKIKSQHLVTVAKWRFLIKNYLLWLLGVLALFFGSIAVSLIIYMIRYSDWQVYHKIDQGFVRFFLLSMPLFWLLCLASFAGVMIYNIKKTKKGYRYSPSFILLLVITANLVLGGLFYGLGLGEKFDRILGKRMPFYGQIMNPQARFWAQTNNGHLAGLIKVQLSESEFVLIDRGHLEWLVKTNPEIMLPIREEQFVRIIGRKVGNNIFEANEILPMRPGRGYFEISEKNCKGEFKCKFFNR